LQAKFDSYFNSILTIKAMAYMLVENDLVSNLFNLAIISKFN